jgi:predicted nucleic acid-binding protein
MTRFVLDASVALSWIFEDERSAYSDYVGELMKDGFAAVPVVWPLEVANALLVAIRRRRLREADGALLIGALDRLRIDIDRGVALESLARTTLAVGLAHQLSSYDASYLELAMRRGLPLATQDARLASAAIAAGVDILKS